jgi:hypothetical protein
MPSDIVSLWTDKCESLEFVTRHARLKQTLVLLSRLSIKNGSVLSEVHFEPRQARIDAHLFDQGSKRLWRHRFQLQKTLCLKLPTTRISKLLLVIH